jgi:hypothetical protein
MNRFLFSIRSHVIAACGAVAILAPAVGASAASAALLQLRPNTKSCTYPALTQPFLSGGDANWYMLAPGQAVDSFSGSGWTLSGGAKVKSATVASGQTASVLDLPSGARAVSPPICVDNGFQTARMMARTVKGAGAVHVSATYEGISLLGIQVSFPRDSGTVRGATNWAASNPVNVRPDDRSGWQVVRFTFAGEGAGSESQIYNYYVDPRMKG